MLENLILFVDLHTPLCFAFAFALIAATYLELHKGGTKITVQSLIQMMNHNQAWVLDVRPPKDYDAGHIEGAANIQLNKVIENLAYIRGRTGTPVLVCETGMSTAGIGEKLIDSGIQVMRLSGGIAEWRHSSIPLVIGRSESGKGKSRKKPTRQGNNTGTKEAGRD